MASAEQGIASLIGQLGEDPDRDGLRDTPARVVRALREMTAGYAADIAAILSARFDADGYDSEIEVRDIPFTALCEHHMLPFQGVAHVAYLPAAGRVVGLSKIPRLVDAYARRLTTQERMTVQIADALIEYGVAQSVTVTIDAAHSCLALRGACKPGATMTTRADRSAP